MKAPSYEVIGELVTRLHNYQRVTDVALPEECKEAAQWLMYRYVAGRPQVWCEDGEWKISQ